MLSNFKAQRSFSHLLCSPPPHETVHSPHSPQLLHTPTMFPIGKVKGKNHKTNSLSGALKTKPKVWLTTLCGGSARKLFPFLPLARVASWSGGRLRARSQMVTIIFCWNPSDLTWSWTECRFHMWRCSHWEGTRQTSLRGPLHQFCHSPICVRTHFTTFYKLRCTMLPPLSLSNVHNWFKVQGGFHLVPQLSFALAAALLMEVEQGAGEELQTPAFCLDSETSKVFITHRLVFWATDIRQATWEATHWAPQVLDHLDKVIVNINNNNKSLTSLAIGRLSRAMIFPHCLNPMHLPEQFSIHNFYSHNIIFSFTIHSFKLKPTCGMHRKWKPGFLRGVVQSLSSWPPPPPKDIWLLYDNLFMDKNLNSFETSVCLFRLKKISPLKLLTWLWSEESVPKLSWLLPYLALTWVSLKSWALAYTLCTSLRLGCLHHPTYCKMIWIRDQDKDKPMWCDCIHWSQ